MKSFSLATLLVLSLFVPTALVSDDGQTQPRLDYGAVIFPNTSTDLISTTNGTGNIRAFSAHSSMGSRALSTYLSMAVRRRHSR